MNNPITREECERNKNYMADQIKSLKNDFTIKIEEAKKDISKDIRLAISELKADLGKDYCRQEDFVFWRNLLVVGLLLSIAVGVMKSFIS